MRARDGRVLAMALALLLTATAAACGASSSTSATDDTSGASAPTSLPGSTDRSGPSGRPVSSVDPIGVGVRRLVVTDPTRSTAARPPQAAAEGRVLPLTVRYPIDAPAAEVEVDDGPPFGTWPLIVFAHGFDASATTYAPLLRDLAASGFVVVAPEFPLSTSTGIGPAVEGDEPAQARDVDFLIDLLTGPDAPPSIGPLVEAGPVGVMGHSDGAQTVLLTGYSPSYINRRIGAVVAVSGRYSSFGGRWFGSGAPPLLVVQSATDELNPFAYGVELVQKDPHTAVLVAVDGTDHLGAVTDARAVVPVAHLLADSFAWWLRSSEAAKRRLAGDESTSPLRLVAAHD